MKNIMTIDVEDWFHILQIKNAPHMSEWNNKISLVEKNFIKLLDIFEEYDVKTTCFFLGWVAKKFPNLVKEADSRGHEIASHGMFHKLVYEMAPNDFFQDSSDSKKILEDICQKEVLGYRAAGFSNTKDTPWFIEKLMDAGYSYDSSLFPKRLNHGGIDNANFAPYKINDNFIEFPITLVNTPKGNKCFFGGGYLRHTKYEEIKEMGQKVMAEGRPIIFYIHPREIDPKHPKMFMPLVRYIKSYGYLKTTEEKLRNISKDFELTSFREFIKNQQLLNV